MDISQEAADKGAVCVAIRRTAFIFRDSVESPEPINFKDSTVIPALSQVSSPRESISYTIGPDNDSYGTSVFNNSGTAGKVNWRECLKRISNSWLYTFVSMIFVLFTLFGDNVRIAATNKNADTAFNWGFVAAMGYFFADSVRLFVSRYDYRWSFAFWLDAVSIVTLLSDIEWLWNNNSTTHQLQHYAYRIGDTSRITSLTFRFIKFVRALRLARMFTNVNTKNPFLSVKSDSMLREEIAAANQRKLFERRMRILQNGGGYRNRSTVDGQHKARKVSAQSEEFPKIRMRNKKLKTLDRLYNEKKMSSIHIQSGDFEVPMESRVSKEITNRTLKLVFVVVMLSSTILPFFGAEKYSSVRSDYQYGLELLEGVYGSPDFVLMMTKYVKAFQSNQNMVTLVHLRFDEEVAWSSEFSYEELRTAEKEEYRTEHLFAIFDIRTYVCWLALLDVLDIFFTCVILLVSALLVTNDYSTTVLFGLERMVALIRKIARDPMLLLSSKNQVDMEPQHFCCCSLKGSLEYGEYEITLLEQTLKKIGVMLALGLGTAGCETITSNIKAAGRLDPLIHGRKIFATFCFISIRSFDILTELLSERLIVYVNKIAKIVHINSEQYQGAINRNLGESFFVVWKFQCDDGMVAGMKITVNPYSMSVKLKTALALIAVIKTMTKIAGSDDMAKFLGNEGMSAAGPFLSHQLSAGLHVGWAFEGPVGSAFKIDATYISPHVNKTARIESATQQYQVSILASDDFVQRLDDEIKPFLRHIDTVLLKGTSDPLMLYSFDMVMQGLGVSHGGETTKKDVEEERERVKTAFEFNYFNVQELFTKSEEIQQLRACFSLEFLTLYQQATEHYIDGRWMQAKDCYHQCLRLCSNDGPTINILKYMEKSGFQCPQDWGGVRTLASK